jgi:hypothetical protein
MIDMWPNRLLQATARLRPGFMLFTSGVPCLSSNVRRMDIFNAHTAESEMTVLKSLAHSSYL